MVRATDIPTCPDDKLCAVFDIAWAHAMRPYGIFPISFLGAHRVRPEPGAAHISVVPLSPETIAEQFY